MSKHLVFYGESIVKHNHLLLEVSGWLYWSKRIKFWQWKKHRTLGRSILVLRKVWGRL